MKAGQMPGFYYEQNSHSEQQDVSLGCTPLKTLAYHTT